MTNCHRAPQHQIYFQAVWEAAEAEEHGVGRRRSSALRRRFDHSITQRKEPQPVRIGAPSLREVLALEALPLSF